jgi:hypothetical protein
LIFPIDFEPASVPVDPICAPPAVMVARRNSIAYQFASATGVSGEHGAGRAFWNFETPDWVVT